MAEYITRVDAIKAVNEQNAFTMTRAALIDVLNSIPAADVAPVVHGRWDIMEGTKTRRVCSKCGWDVPEHGKFYSYCPNCGAKMDGAE